MLPTQEYLLKLLLEIDDICKRHDIEYFLAYGTLLGAVRHEGFIPWDNDLDIVMDWDEYVKFRAACEEELDGVTRTLQDNRYNREFSLCCGHYTDLTTCRMSSRTVFWEPLCGQYIDIFVAVEMPGGIDAMRERYNLYCAYDEYSNPVYVHQGGKNEEIMNIYRGFKRREEEIGRIATLEEIEADLFGHRYDDCEYCFTNSAHMGNFLAFMPKHAVHDLVDAPFEGHMLPIPRDWATVLTWWYGDRFNIIPRNEKVHSEMSHTGLPAACYVNDYMEFLDRDYVVKTLATFKESGVENGATMGEDRHVFYAAQALVVRRRLMQRLEALAEQRGTDPQACAAATDPATLEALNPVVHEYVGKQLNSDARYYRERFDMPDWVEEAAWRVLAYWRFDLSGVNKMAALRWYNRLGFTDGMKDVMRDADRLRSVRRALLYGAPERARDDLEALKAKLPWMTQVRVYDLRFKLALAEGDADLRECVAIADGILADAPGNDSCRKAKADALARLGDTGAAQAIYDELKSTTDDGLILLDIGKRERRMTEEA